MPTPVSNAVARGAFRFLLLLVVGAVIAVLLPVSFAPAEGQTTEGLAEIPSGTNATEAGQSPIGDGAVPTQASPTTTSPAATPVAPARPTPSASRAPGTATIDPNSLTTDTRGGSTVLRARVATPAQGGRLGE